MSFSPPTQSFCLLAIDVLKDSHFTFRLVICVVEEEDDDYGGGECGVVELRFTDTVTWILIGGSSQRDCLGMDRGAGGL